MGFRRRSREAALKIIYQKEMTGYETEDCIKSYWEDLGEKEEIKDFCNFLVRGVFNMLPAIDEKIRNTASNWKIERMHKVDLSILRMAVFEMFYTSDTPYKVIINEAIELAKKYGTENSSAFVNGILNKLAQEVKIKDK